MFADCPADGPVFLVDLPCFRQEPFPNLLGRELPTADRRTLFHPFQGPEEVDGCRAGGCQKLHDLLQSLEEFFLTHTIAIPQAKAYPVCGSNADRWCTSDLERIDRLPQCLLVTAIDVSELAWEEGLVEDAEVPIKSADPLQGCKSVGEHGCIDSKRSARWLKHFSQAFQKPGPFWQWLTISVQTPP